MADPHPPEEGLLGVLDGPRLVVGAFAFFIVGLLVLLIVLWTDTRQIQNERAAEQLAAKNAQVATCVTTATQAPALQLVLRAVQSDLESEAAKAALRDYRRQLALNSPTLRECRQLAMQLNVPIPKEVR